MFCFSLFHYAGMVILLTLLDRWYTVSLLNSNQIVFSLSSIKFNFICIMLQLQYNQEAQSALCLDRLGLRLRLRGILL